MAEIEQRTQLAQENKQSMQTFNTLMADMAFIQQDVNT